MSGYKDKVTKGEWLVSCSDETGYYIEAKFDGYVAVVHYWSRPDDEVSANATLCAEAGTVLHETGYTPRELAEQRAELLAALKAVNTELSAAWDARILPATAVSGTTIQAMLAAIAKCEGGAR